VGKRHDLGIKTLLPERKGSPICRASHQDPKGGEGVVRGLWEGGGGGVGEEEGGGGVRKKSGKGGEERGGKGRGGLREVEGRWWRGEG